MDDLELVLRFFTIKEKWTKLGKKISIAMDAFMAENRQGPVNKLKADFDRSINACERIWEKNAFQKPTQAGWRDQLIAPLFDAQMVAVSLVDDEKIDFLAENQGVILKGTAELYTGNSVFLKAATQATGDSSAIKNRIEEMVKMLNSVGV